MTKIKTAGGITSTLDIFKAPTGVWTIDRTIYSWEGGLTTDLFTGTASEMVDLYDNLLDNAQEAV